VSPLQKGISHREEATLAPHCVPWHRPAGQVWCSAGEIAKILKKKFKNLKTFRNFFEYLRGLLKFFAPFVSSR
jgi:hypothetical protein